MIIVHINLNCEVRDDYKNEKKSKRKKKNPNIIIENFSHEHLIKKSIDVNLFYVI